MLKKNIMLSGIEKTESFLPLKGMKHTFLFDVNKRLQQSVYNMVILIYLSPQRLCQPFTYRQIQSKKDLKGIPDQEMDF